MIALHPTLIIRWKTRKYYTVNIYSVSVSSLECFVFMKRQVSCSLMTCNWWSSLKPKGYSDLTNINTIVVSDISMSTLMGYVRLMVLNATFNNISFISWRSVVLVGETVIAGENHRPVASHWQTLSHNYVSITPRLSGIRTHNVRGDSYWLHG